MKTKKYASIAIALLWGFMIHAFLSLQIYFKSNFFGNYFSTSVGITVLYFILFLMSFGFFIVEPYEFLKEEIKKQEETFNWWWDIYLSGWALLVFAIIECLMMGANFVRIQQDLVGLTLIFFLIKGAFLIPSFLINRQYKEQTKLYVGLAFLEIILILVIYGLGKALEEVGSVFS